MTPPECPRCGAAMELRNTMRFRYGNGERRRYWCCPRYPECPSVCGAHPDGRPPSTPADELTKRARNHAHAAFDPLWKSGEMTREAAYYWLRKAMGLTWEQCHIGFFNVDQCQQVIALVAERNKGRKLWGINIDG